MIPTVLSYDHSETAAAVDMALETGRTIIFPTDTVYGIGGNPWDERTLAHVRRLKEREPNQPFALHLCRVCYLNLSISLCALYFNSSIRADDRTQPASCTLFLFKLDMLIE